MGLKIYKVVWFLYLSSWPQVSSLEILDQKITINHRLTQLYCDLSERCADGEWLPGIDRDCAHMPLVVCLKPTQGYVVLSSDLLCSREKQYWLFLITPYLFIFMCDGKDGRKGQSIHHNKSVGRSMGRMIDEDVWLQPWRQLSLWQ